LCQGARVGRVGAALIAVNELDLFAGEFAALLRDIALGARFEQRAVVGEGTRERGNDADLDGLGSDAAHGERGSKRADQLPLKTHVCLLGWCLRSGRRS